MQILIAFQNPLKETEAEMMVVLSYYRPGCDEGLCSLSPICGSGFPPQSEPDLQRFSS